MLAALAPCEVSDHLELCLPCDYAPRQHRASFFPWEVAKLCLPCDSAPRQHLSQPLFSHSPPLAAYCRLGDSAGRWIIFCRREL